MLYHTSYEYSMPQCHTQCARTQPVHRASALARSLLAAPDEIILYTNTATTSADRTQSRAPSPSSTLTWKISLLLLLCFFTVGARSSSHPPPPLPPHRRLASWCDEKSASGDHTLAAPSTCILSSQIVVTNGETLSIMGQKPTPTYTHVPGSSSGSTYCTKGYWIESAYAKVGGGGASTSGGSITKDDALASVVYCSSAAAERPECSTKYFGIGHANGQCFCVTDECLATEDNSANHQLKSNDYSEKLATITQNVGKLDQEDQKKFEKDCSEKIGEDGVLPIDTNIGNGKDCNPHRLFWVEWGILKLQWVRLTGGNVLGDSSGHPYWPGKPGDHRSRLYNSGGLVFVGDGTKTNDKGPAELNMVIGVFLDGGYGQFGGGVAAFGTKSTVQMAGGSTVMECLAGGINDGQASGGGILMREGEQRKFFLFFSFLFFSFLLYYLKF